MTLRTRRKAQHVLFLNIVLFLNRSISNASNGAITAAKTEKGSVSAPEREQIEKSVGFPSDLT